MFVTKTGGLKIDYSRARLIRTANAQKNHANYLRLNLIEFFVHQIVGVLTNIT